MTQYINFPSCKKTQKIFSECLKEKIGLEPPELGHFAKVKYSVHDQIYSQVKHEMLGTNICCVYDNLTVYYNFVAFCSQYG